MTDLKCEIRYRNKGGNTITTYLSNGCCTVSTIWFDELSIGYDEFYKEFVIMIYQYLGGNKDFKQLMAMIRVDSYNIESIND